MILTDTHTHLYNDDFDEDREVMIQRAKSEGIQRFFVPAIDSTYTERMYELEKHHPDSVFLMAGLHPTHVKENLESELAAIQVQLETRKFYAIGEIGMDLHWDTTFVEAQKYAFVKQIQWAKKYKLPIVIHCRKAFDEVFEILEAEQGEELVGILHCFTGTLEQARQAISYGMKLGIGGVVTFKNGKIDTFLKQIPLENIVLETDAPYLSPVPFRGKRNESSYLKLIANKVASIYGMSLEEIANKTTNNSKEIFGV